MNRTRLFLLLFAAISLFLLSGCVNLVEEITVEEDGSGSVYFAMGVESASYPEFRLAIPENLELENLLSSLIQDENVTNVSRDQFEADGRTWDSMTLNFADILTFFEVGQEIGPLTITLNEGQDGQFAFRQTINIADANINIPGINLLDLTGAGYTIRLFTPQIVDTNGLQRAAGLSAWSIAPADLLQEGEVVFLQADFVLEPYEGVFIPWEVFFPYVVIGFLVLGGVAIFAVIIINTSRREEEVEKIKF